MKTIKSILIGCTFGLFLAVTAARAQSTWNFVISDAGDGNSLVTWTVTGALTTPPGAPLFQSPFQAISISAPGIYKNTYLADGTAQSIPTPDGSYFNDPSVGNIPITEYYTYAPIQPLGVITINDGFGLLVPIDPTHSGDLLLYNPGTESIVIPVDFSDFNPGTYQAADPVFQTPLTVNLTVVPEPSTQALAAVAALGAVFTVRRRKQ